MTAYGLEADVDAEKINSLLIRAGSVLGNLALLACCYSNQTNKDFELKSLFLNYEGYVYGYLIAVNSMSLLVVDIKENNVHVESVNETIMNKLKDFFLGQSPEYYDFIKKIQDFFGISDTFWKTESNK